MTCRTCAQWASISLSQYHHRQERIARNPEVSVAICPQCGGTDWVTTKDFLLPEPSGWRALFIWVIICAVLGLIYLTLVRSAAGL